MGKSLVQEILEHLLVCCSRLAVGALFVPYGQSLSRSLRKVEEVAADCPHDFSKHSRSTVSVTLQRMKKHNLVTARGSHKKAVWQITKRGRNHFKGTMDSLVLPPEDGKIRVFMFDIPEDRRGERNRLRAELLSCGYSPLQKSVFIGKRPLPTKLFKELRERNLMSYIHVAGLEDRI